jgi:hypothetical protein
VSDTKLHPSREGSPYLIGETQRPLVQGTPLQQSLDCVQS